MRIKYWSDEVGAWQDSKTGWSTFKIDFREWYPVIGLRVHGKVNPIGIFTEHWYGRRVDRNYTEVDNRTYRKLGVRRDLSYGMASKPYVPLFWRTEYARQAKLYKSLWDRVYLKHYLRGRRNWGDSRTEWSDLETGWTMMHFSYWGDELYHWSLPFIGWSNL